MSDILYKLAKLNKSFGLLIVPKMALQFPLCTAIDSLGVTGGLGVT